MRKLISRYSLILVIFLLSLILFSPFLALFAPLRLRNHIYAEMVYQVIADEETKSCQTQEDKIINLFNYVRKHIHPKGFTYQGKPLDYLIWERGWCDYQARTLNSLLGRLRILSRYAMLMDKDKDGDSPHTLNEIFINGKWAIFDTMFNVVFKYGSKYLDTADLKKNPNLITSVINNATPSEDADQAYLSVLLLRTLPFEDNWRRSTPRLKQYHILDYLIGFYVKIFGNSFSHFYQDCYLKFSLAKISEPDQRLFLKARNYHLLYREKLAAKCYEELMKNFPSSKYFIDCKRLRNSLAF